MLRDVRIEMYSGEKLDYSNVSRIEEANHQYKLYGVAGDLLAAISVGDVKNLFSTGS